MSDAAMLFALKRLANSNAKVVNEQGAENGPGLNPLHKLIDSERMHVVLVGTGTPIASEIRSGPCTAIVGKGNFFLVDVGPGATRSCTLLGLPLRRLNGIFISHFHSDHIGDLGEMMTMAFITGRQSKLMVFGPPGIRSVVDGFASAYKLDGGYRVVHHHPLFDSKFHGFDCTEIVVEPESVERTLCYSLKCGSTNEIIDIFAFNVDHTPVSPAYGFRFETRDAIIVVSGDTKECPSLTANCSNAHLVIQEAICSNIISTIAGCQCAMGNLMVGKILNDVTNYHTGVQGCVDLAAANQISMMVLTHVVPAPDNFLLSRLFFSGIVRPNKYDGTIAIGEDGMIVKVNALDGSKPCTVISPGKNNKTHMTKIIVAIIGAILGGIITCVVTRFSPPSVNNTAVKEASQCLSAFYNDNIVEMRPFVISMCIIIGCGGLILLRASRLVRKLP